MRFYNREFELKILGQLDEKSLKTGVLTVLTGRRRVGKTLLALHHSNGKKFLYLFVGRKDESLLCQEFLEEIKKHFALPIIGEIKSFIDIFVLLLELSK